MYLVLKKPSVNKDTPVCVKLHTFTYEKYFYIISARETSKLCVCVCVFTLCYSFWSKSNPLST